jgi:hypothetical protein
MVRGLLAELGGPTAAVPVILSTKALGDDACRTTF